MILKFPSQPTVIALAVCLGVIFSKEYAVAATRAAHPVTMHVESFAGKGVVVAHLSSVPAGLRSSTDSTRLDIDSLTVQTPADVWVNADVRRLELRTDGNLAVRVSFTDGASASERALRPWGRRLLFVRVDGDLQPRAELIPAQP